MIISHFRQIFEDASSSEYGTVVYASVTQSSDISDYGSIHLNNA